MNTVDFTVPLCGSKLFDLNTLLTAQNLCAKFPGLKYDHVDGKHIHIYGELSDYWMNEFNKAVFQLGEM